MPNDNYLINEKCRSQSVSKFKKGETILSTLDDTGRIGVLQSGEAHVVQVDSNGNQSILEFLASGDSFGEYLMGPSVKAYNTVIADTDCVVIFINFRNVIFNCKGHCENHAELVKTLLLLSSHRAQMLSVHVRILSAHTTHDKLLLYFKNEAALMGSHEFHVPISLTRLADYLAVDRSAMMRELGKLKKEGIITKTDSGEYVLNADAE